MSKNSGQRKNKQEDKFALAVRDVQASCPENKLCFDCDQRGPTYVNMTIGSFVCTKCSGMLRGINPPHRIKSISMSTFTTDEVDSLRMRGNAWCARVWLATYDKQANPMDSRDEERIRDFIIAKYERKRYYVEPSEAPRLPRSSPSVSSLSSTSSQESRPFSNLIGSTLKASITQNQQQPAAHSTISVSRPAAAVATAHSNNNHHNSQQQHRSQDFAFVSQQQQPKDAFADFANFDAVAFDSLPADPLAAPPPPPAVATLPPIRKTSQEAVKPSAAATAVEPDRKQSAGQDRYSALKELDELFKSTTINSPTTGESAGGVLGELGLFASPPAPIPAKQQQHYSNGIFREHMNGSPAPILGRNSPSPALWASPAQQQHGWASPAQQQHGWASPAQQQHGWGPSAWGQSATAPAQQQHTMPAAANSWPANQGWGTPTAGYSTNPFGTSPSAAQQQPLHQQTNNFHFPDNNNDLFAAAPKPFLSSDKPGMEFGVGNPWSSVPAFTANMTPAPNPHNPFL